MFDKSGVTKYQFKKNRIITSFALWHSLYHSKYEHIKTSLLLKLTQPDFQYDHFYGFYNNKFETHSTFKMA